MAVIAVSMIGVVACVPMTVIDTSVSTIVNHRSSDSSMSSKWKEAFQISGLWWKIPRGDMACAAEPGGPTALRAPGCGDD